MVKKRVLSLVLSVFLVLNMLPAYPLYAENNDINASVISNPSDEEERAMLYDLFANTLAQHIADGHVSITNIKFRYGDNDASTNLQIGAFSQATGTGAYDILEFDSGLALSTGKLEDGVNYNTNKIPSNGSNTVSHQVSSRRDFINGERVYDPCSIEFDLVVSSEAIEEMTMQYAFASEEYMKYSLGKYNDKFAIMVNNENYAKIPGTDEPICINTVNQKFNTEFFRPNINQNGVQSLNLRIPMNGITKTFTASIPLHQGTNHFKIVLGDMGDKSYDSILFLKAGSFKFNKFDAGILSVTKDNAATPTQIIVSRNPNHGGSGTDGNISFTLVEENMLGEQVETVYIIPDGQSSLAIDIAVDATDAEAHPEKIAHDAMNVFIKDATMGAAIDTDHDSALLKIAPPVLTKKEGSTTGIKDTIVIRGEPNASVTLTKVGGTSVDYTLDANGEKKVPNQAVGKYTATQTYTVDGTLMTSAPSNKVTVKKPPIISSTVGTAFDTITIEKTSDAYNTTPLAVTAKQANGNAIALNNGNMTEPYFHEKNPLDSGCDTAGIYTIQWTAKDGGFTVTKTKIVKVRPSVVGLTTNYKNSVINVTGEPNGVAKLTAPNGVEVLVPLDAAGKGTLVDPIDGTYTAVQVVNGVESTPSSIAIARKDTPPTITLQSDNPLELYYEESGSEEYTEPGATANDDEDDKEPNALHTDGHNKKLTKAITIDNPMFTRTKLPIHVTNPALTEDGTPIAENSAAFTPFLGKYEVKYEVKDSDGNAADDKIRLVKVYPPLPETNVPAQNNDSRINVVDAISSASIFLYNENGEPVHIEDGVVHVIGDDKQYTDEHTKIKIEKSPDGNDLGVKQTDLFTGLPNGTYKILQRMYGLNSSLSAPIMVTRNDTYPTITVKGTPTVVLVKGDDYNDAGATAHDDQDGDLTDRITTSGSSTMVDTGQVGRYEVEYRVTDNDNNTTTAKRIVIVKPPMPEAVVGNYDEDTYVFTEDPNGNDLKVWGLEPNATVQLVKGHGGNGALYQENGDIIKNGGAIHIFKNLAKTAGTPDKYAVFQTVNSLQSAKNQSHTIEKGNTKPVVTVVDKQVLSVVKGASESIETGEEIATATDQEDGDITAKVRIYKESEVTIDEEGVVTPKAGNHGVESLVLPTDVVGAQKYYYIVKDSDGNYDVDVKDIHVLPTAPSIETVGSEKVNVFDAEAGAVIELYKVQDDGTEILFATGIADASGLLEFTDLDTGKYKAKQVAKGLESGFSEEVAFANPAYVTATIVDKDDHPMNDVEFTLIDVDDSMKKAKSGESGKVVFGVESADYPYTMTFKNNGNELFVKGISSESSGDTHTENSIVGAINQNGSLLMIPADKLSFRLQKKVGAEWKDTKVAKCTYHDGTYLLNHLTPSQEYKVEIVYREDDVDYTLSTFVVQAAAGAGRVKVANQELSSGTVKDAEGNSLSGVSVEVYYPDRDGNPDYEKGLVTLPSIPQLEGTNDNGTKTNANGTFAYSVLDKTTYVLLAKKAGYDDVVVKVEGAEGNLLVADITMNAGSGSNSGDSSGTGTGNGSGSPDVFDGVDDSSGTGNGSTGNDSTKPTGDTTGQGPEQTTPQSVEPKPLIPEDGNGNNGTSVDTLSDHSYVQYQSENTNGDDRVVDEPEKGRVFINPISGTILYLPRLGAQGDDQFSIQTRDEAGNPVTVDKTVTIRPNGAGNNTGNKAPSNSLVLQLSTPKDHGFTGDEFTVTADFRNNTAAAIPNATVAIRIPEGFSVEEEQYTIQNGYLLVAVSNLRKGQRSSFDFTLKANDENMRNSQLTAVIQDNASDRIYPEAVSSLGLDVLNQNTKYIYKPYVEGTPEGDFKRLKHVSRAEVATMLTRCLMNLDESIVLTDYESKGFTDVASDAWYNNYVGYMVENGLFAGKGNGTFGPDDSITRGELAQVIGNYLALDISERGVVDEYYSDIEGHWAQDSINALRRYGIAIGFEDGTFRPDKPITREETVKMINNMLNRVVIPNMLSSFGDMNEGHWSFGDIESAYRGYEIEKHSDGTVTITPLR